MSGNDPFWRLPEVPSFALTSEDVQDGARLSPAQMSGIFEVPGGSDTSPQLSWIGAPAATRSYAVTMVDPDAPTMSGFWHWAVAGIPATVTSLEQGAGDEGGPGLPSTAIQLRNDAGSARFLGAAPPSGHGEHRYFITVHALDTEDLEIDAMTSPALLGFKMSFHILARATIIATAEIS
ncbi:MAG: YbhB/YbcL family Raf kinase inhibitor-like protein [Actinomycetota bacterium]|nr:YbhB/YbcL family Raf kinase inhibitor-like protein [Actinomycetota bacterium]